MSQEPVGSCSEQLTACPLMEQIPQATGVVMALGRLDASRAVAVLSEVSQRTGIAVELVAELLTVWAPSGELNLGLRIALEEAIRGQHRSTRRRTPSAPARTEESKHWEGVGESHAVPQG